MALSEKDIIEFKELLEKTYNVKVTNEYAEEAAENLLNFFRTLINIDAKQRNREAEAQGNTVQLHGAK